jgi:hypothetical protein
MAQYQLEHMQYIRHQAYQIAGALPQDPRAALQIVEEVRKLLIEANQQAETATAALRIIATT